MTVLRKEIGGTTLLHRGVSYHWPAEDPVCDVPPEFAAELLAIRGGGFFDPGAARITQPHGGSIPLANLDQVIAAKLDEAIAARRAELARLDEEIAARGDAAGTDSGATDTAKTPARTRSR